MKPDTERGAYREHDRRSAGWPRSTRAHTFTILQLQHALARTGLAAVVAASAGCRMRVPEPAIHTGSPHLSWIIMRGDRENPDQNFVCQSEPRSDCVIPRSRADAPVFSSVHVYYHPASSDTRYTGSIGIRFFQGAGDQPESHVVRVDTTVKANTAPYHQGVTDLVTDKPGAYSIAIAIDATPITIGSAHQIREDVRVLVR